MQLVPAREHDRRPFLDPYQIRVWIRALLAACKSLLRRPPPPHDTSIAWEDGESDERDGAG
jgi:hypothetical protein